MAIVENIQREDLNAMEMAFSLQRLIDECQLTHEQLSIRVGKQRSTVSNFLRLLKLPPQVQQSLRKEDITMGHARAIAGLEEISSQLMVLGDVLSKQLSVRETEKLVAAYLDKGPTKKDQNKTQNKRSADVDRVQQRLRSLIGMPVALKYNPDGSGDIRIPFKNDKELNYIVNLLDELENA